MPYDIDSCDIIDGDLYITQPHIDMFNALVESRDGDYLPEGWESIRLGDGGRLENLPFHGEGSGHGEGLLREFLGLTAGTAAILLCWEGGDSYTGLVVENGKVYDGEVVQAVRKKNP